MSANEEDYPGALKAGAVYAFRWNGAWVETGRIVPADLAGGDHFGESLAISGARAVVGATLVNNGPAFNQGNVGAAYVLELGAGGGWSVAAKIRTPAPIRDGKFGIAAVLQGDEAIIGALEEGTIRSGQVHSFDISPLEAEPTSWSASGGGGRAWSVERRQTLELNAGPSFAGFSYQVLGSLSGSSPGLDLPGGVHLPLNLDGYFNYTLAPNGPPLRDSLGTLDANGRAQALFEFRGRIPLALIGRTVHHAFVVTASGSQDVLYASNAQPLVIGP